MSQPMDEPTDAREDDNQELEFLNGSSREPEAESKPPVENDTREFIARIELEIEQEVKARRAQGAFPPAFERRLKTIFERLVPPGAGNSRRDFEALLRSSDRAAYFDIDVPIASQKRGVANLKKILRTTQAWYLNYLAQQLNNFSTNLMRLLYVFDARVKKLEDSTRSASQVLPGGEYLKPCYPSSEGLAESVVSQMKEASGRILVADCGDGYLVSKLRGQDADCYGVDSFGQDFDTAYESNLDLRWDDLMTHLRTVADGALSGIVLQGSTDLISPTERIELALEAARVLQPDGIAVVVSIDPTWYENSTELVVQRDLAPRGPFAPETWRHLLKRISFSRISTESLETCHVTIGHRLADVETVDNEDEI